MQSACLRGQGWGIVWLSVWTQAPPEREDRGEEHLPSSVVTGAREAHHPLSSHCLSLLKVLHISCPKCYLLQTLSILGSAHCTVFSVCNLALIRHKQSFTTTIPINSHQSSWSGHLRYKKVTYNPMAWRRGEEGEREGTTLPSPGTTLAGYPSHQCGCASW